MRTCLGPDSMSSSRWQRRTTAFLPPKMPVEPVLLIPFWRASFSEVGSNACRGASIASHISRSTASRNIVRRCYGRERTVVPNWWPFPTPPLSPSTGSRTRTHAPFISPYPKARDLEGKNRRVLLYTKRNSHPKMSRSTKGYRSRLSLGRFRIFSPLGNVST